MRSDPPVAAFRAALHTAVFRQPARLPPEPQRMAFDGPLLGNGDIGIGVAGTADEQVFHIGKNDFWNDIPLPFTAEGCSRTTDGDTTPGPLIAFVTPHGHLRSWPRASHQPGVISVAQWTLRIPSLEGASFLQEQDLSQAEMRGEYRLRSLGVRIRCIVAAEDPGAMLRIENTGTGSLPLSLSLRVPRSADRDYPTAAGSSEGCVWVERSPNPGGERWRTKVALALRVIGAVFEEEHDDRSATVRADLPPGRAIDVAGVIVSCRDASDPAGEACRQAARAQPAEWLDRHRRWWKEYWDRSAVENPDPLLERAWYGTQYLLGCASRPGRVAPGLYGPWVFHDYPLWCGDYHLNYNFQSPFLGAYGSNRAEWALPFVDAANACIPFGRRDARRFNCAGVHFPVSFGPDGHPVETNDWGQRSNALFCAVNYLWHWRATLDPALLRRRLYPFLEEVAAFWECYLKRDSEGRWAVFNSCANEDFDLLREVLGRQMLPNLYIAQEGGGIETLGTALALNEMLLQSHGGCSVSSRAPPLAMPALTDCARMGRFWCPRGARRARGFSGPDGIARRRGRAPKARGHHA